MHTLKSTIVTRVGDGDVDAISNLLSPGSLDQKLHIRAFFELDDDDIVVSTSNNIAVFDLCVDLETMMFEIVTDGLKEVGFSHRLQSLDELLVKSTESTITHNDHMQRSVWFNIFPGALNQIFDVTYYFYISFIQVFVYVPT